MSVVARFAVGSPDDYRSAIWWLGVNGANAWVAAKPRESWWRLTVQSNANGRLVNSTESGPTPPETGGAVLRAWRPAGPERMSWEHGFTIMVPTLGPVNPLPHIGDRNLDLVDWSAPAPEGHSVNFKLWSASTAPKGEHIATLALSGGDVVLMRTYDPVPVGLMRYFRSSVGYAPTIDAPGSLVNYDTGDDHEALLFDLPFHSPH